MWLRVAATASVAGNVWHAALSDPPSMAVAATLAIVPPSVLLAAAHGVALLVRADIDGPVYRWSVAGTAFLGCAAAVLSFRTLADLASRWGGHDLVAAYLIPVVIDASIALSTLGLLALTRPAVAAVIDAAGPEPAPEAEARAALPAAEGEPLADVTPIPKRPDERRELTVRFRVSATEQAELEDLAAHLDRLPAEAARDVVLAAARRPRAQAA